MRTACLLTIALLGCGDARSATLDGGQPLGDGAAPSMDASRPAADADSSDSSVAPDASVASDAGSDAGAPIVTCVVGCSASIECSQGSAAYDADNYDCSAGACRYRGCNDDGECQASFASPNYGCYAQDSGSHLCAISCSSSSDCGTDAGAFGADNYECVGGGCRYRGCHDDAECQTSFASDRYGCSPDARCVYHCTSNADCGLDTGAFSSANYDCVAGYCAYRGCHDDAECMLSFSRASEVCR